jgi:hypothetical protein
MIRRLPPPWHADKRVDDRLLGDAARDMRDSTALDISRSGQMFDGAKVRPGGNVTGISFINSQLGPKRIQLLRLLNPRTAVVAVLVKSQFMCFR